MGMGTIDDLPRRLREWADRYETEAFIASDPVRFPRRYTGANAEVSAFLTSWVSFGRREQIMEAAERIDLMFGGRPYAWLRGGDYKDLAEDRRKLYRFLSYDDLYRLCERLDFLYGIYDSMWEALFDSGRGYVGELSTWLKGVRGIPDHAKGSACKRLCLFLRWMVREGPVDLGRWPALDRRKLIIPLDTHVHRMALELGITRRKQADMRTAMEITDYFKDIFPGDPARGDFALFGYGIEHKRE